MTDLERSVTRKAEASRVRDGGKSRALVVTLYPGGVIGLRPERCRKNREETISLTAVWELAVKARVRTERREKAAAKRAGR